MKLRNLLIAAVGLALAGGAAGAASAATPWHVRHTRRVEVNHRLEHLNRSIAVKRREGELTRRQAMAMHAHVHAIRTQERRYARNDRGHITKVEQHRLNHEENVVHNHLPA